MLLDRLRIRGRLALLILVMLIAAIVQTVAAAVEIGDHATRAADTAARVHSAGEVAVLVRSLQQERLAAVGLLLHRVDRGDLLLAQATTDDAVDVVRTLALPTVDGGLGDLGQLTQLRAGVASGALPPAAIITGYSQLVTNALDSIRLPDVVDGDTEQGKAVIALDGVLRANEGFAEVLASMLAGGTPNIVSSYLAGLDLLGQGALRFVAYATPEEAGLYGIAQQAVNARLGPDFNGAMIAAPSATIGILNTRRATPMSRRSAVSASTSSRRSSPTPSPPPTTRSGRAPPGPSRSSACPCSSSWWRSCSVWPSRGRSPTRSGS